MRALMCACTRMHRYTSPEIEKVEALMAKDDEAFVKLQACSAPLAPLLLVMIRPPDPIDATLILLALRLVRSGERSTPLDEVHLGTCVSGVRKGSVPIGAANQYADDVYRREKSAARRRGLRRE